MPQLLSPQRILLVTRNLPPLVGGMERLNWHMAHELSRHAQVRVIGPRGAAALAPAGVAVDEIALRPLWRFLAQAQWRAVREARRWRPDVVLAGSGLTAPAALMAARAAGARAAVYVHGLDLTVRHPVYKSIWLPALRRMDRVIANSRPTAALAERIGIAPARIGIVHPGVELPAGACVQPPDPPVGACVQATDPAVQATDPPVGACVQATDPAAKPPEAARVQPPDRAPLAPVGACVQAINPAHDFRQHHHLGNGPLLLSVGRLSERKGLREFVSHALPRVTATHPDVTLLIVGDAPNDALHAQAQTPQSIRAAAHQAGVADTLRFLGRVSDDELNALYRAADVHIFPVRDIPGDPEGFGMVAIEAAAHGLPTVAFATGGVIDAVAEGESGHLVSPGDYPAFAAAVLHALAERQRLRESCVAFAQRFAWPNFGTQLAAQLARP